MNETIVRSNETKNFGYRVVHDPEPFESPREWDNLGTMVCWHKNYTLGDEQPKSRWEEWMSELLAELYPEKRHDDKWYDFLDKAYYGEEKYLVMGWKLVHDRAVVLPLYLYDHSGISISTSSFNGRAHHAEWDSGQVGWIYVSIADVKKEYDWKNLTQKRREQIEKYLRGEVETYDQYLTGEVYGYEVYEKNDWKDIVDSCWGFYGLDYCEQEARSMMDYHQQKKNAVDDNIDRLCVIHADELVKLIGIV